MAGGRPRPGQSRPGAGDDEKFVTTVRVPGTEPLQVTMPTGSTPPVRPFHGASRAVRCVGAPANRPERTGHSRVTVPTAHIGGTP